MAAGCQSYRCCILNDSKETGMSVNALKVFSGQQLLNIGVLTVSCRSWINVLHAPSVGTIEATLYYKLKLNQFAPPQHFFLQHWCYSYHFLHYRVVPLECSSDILILFSWLSSFSVERTLVSRYTGSGSVFMTLTQR